MSIGLHPQGRRNIRGVLATFLLAAMACGESKDSTSLRSESSAGSGGGGQGSPGEQTGQDCFENPTNHLELINACTRAVRVERSPSLQLLEADGSLPPPP